jgi:transcriptional regulator GlxA family with amidase domain
VNAAYRTLEKAVYRPGMMGQLNANGLARRLGVSVRTLTRAFRASVGVPVQYFISLYRFYCFDVLVHSYQPITVKDALQQMDVRSFSHFIKVYLN